MYVWLMFQVSCLTFDYYRAVISSSCLAFGSVVLVCSKLWIIGDMSAPVSLELVRIVLVVFSAYRMG